MQPRADRQAADDGLLPKYHQIYLVLSQQIRDGEYSDAVPIPGEVELGRQFGVSRITIRKALERLEREGAIHRHRGRGTFVSRTDGDGPLAASLSGSIENLIAMGLETEVRLLSLAHVPASAEVAAALGIAQRAPVQRAVRVRSHQGVPFSFLTTHVPEDLGRAFGEKDLETTPLLLLLERAGVCIKGAEQRITAKLATPAVAGHLQVEPGVPLLSITRTVADESDRVVELIHGLYRPDTYEHRMRVDRIKRDDAPLWRA